MTTSCECFFFGTGSHNRGAMVNLEVSGWEGVALWDFQNNNNVLFLTAGWSQYPNDDVSGLYLCSARDDVSGKVLCTCIFVNAKPMEVSEGKLTFAEEHWFQRREAHMELPCLPEDGAVGELPMFVNASVTLTRESKNKHVLKMTF